MLFFSFGIPLHTFWILTEGNPVFKIGGCKKSSSLSHETKRNTFWNGHVETFFLIWCRYWRLVDLFILNLWYIWFAWWSKFSKAFFQLVNGLLTKAPSSWWWRPLCNFPNKTRTLQRLLSSQTISVCTNLSWQSKKENN